MLSDLLGESGMVKVLDFLIDKPDFDFSKAELAKKTDLTWQTVNSVFPKLEEVNLIEPTRMIGRSQMFKLNIGSPLFLKIREMDWELSKIENQRYR